MPNNMRVTGGYPPPTGEDPTSASAPVSPSAPIPATDPTLTSPPLPGWPPPPASAPPVPESPAPLASAPPVPVPPASDSPALAWPPVPAPPEVTWPAAPSAPDFAAAPGWVPPPATPDLTGAPGWAPVPPVRKSRVGLVVGIVAGVIVLVLIAGVSFLLVANRLSGQPIAASTVPPSPTPTTPPPVSPESYQSALDQVDQAIAPKFAAVVAAKHPNELKTAAADLSTAIGAQATTLTAITPPTAVASAHQHLTAALTTFAANASSSEISNVCAGPSALSYLSQSTGADRLRTAIAEVAAADSSHPYKVGTFLPASTPDPNRTLANGARIKSAKSSSSNRLTVKNQSTQDIVVSLTVGASTTATLMFYVAANNSATYVGIANGTYDIWYTSGVDWDAGTEGFTRRCSYLHDASTLAFKETSTKYDVWTVTLSNSLFWRDEASGFPT
jgi:hypothetical protein